MARRIFAVIAMIGMTSACSNSDPPVDHRLDGLRSALALHPDSGTRAAMRTLVDALNVEEWGYLTYAQWPDGDGRAAITDPTLRKAMDALARADGFVLDGQTERPMAAWAAGGLHPASLPPGEVSFDPDAVAAANRGAVLLMVEKNGLGYAGSPGAAAAFAALLYGLIGTTSGSPLPDPVGPADGPLDGCGKYWQEFPDGTKSPNCSVNDFCCEGVVEFKKGTLIPELPPEARDPDPKQLATIATCHDFTSCRGQSPLPKFTGCECGADESDDTMPPAGTPGGVDVSNPCFVGDAVKLDPAPWVDACEHLSPMTPTPIVCLDANPALHLPGGALPDGRDPARVCKVFTNEDGIGTSLGQPYGCDHEGGLNMTCYCCPSD